MSAPPSRRLPQDDRFGASKSIPPAFGLGRLDQTLQNVQCRRLDQVAQQKLLTTRKTLHGRDQPGEKTKVRLQRRAGFARTVNATGTWLSGGHFAQDWSPIWKKRQGGTAPLDPPRGNDVKIQGVTVRATRKPRLLLRLSVLSSLRPQDVGKKSLHEPPRNTRSEHSPLSHADPSVGAPS